MNIISCMQKIQKILSEIGLNNEELNLYLYILQNEQNTVLSIAKETKIPRTTVYLLVGSLTQRGLIEERIINQKKLLIPAKPETLLLKLQEKKDSISDAIYEVRDLLPQLSGIYNTHVGKPSTAYYEGSEEVFKIIRQGLLTDKIYIYAPSGCFGDNFSLYMDDFYQKMDEKFIYSKEIYLKNYKESERVEASKSVRNQAIFLPEIFKSPIDTIFFDGIVLSIGYKNASVYGILQKNKEIEHSEKMKFIMIWQYLSGKMH
jgi:sugar-specific transcriptional regulator TrmB